MRAFATLLLLALAVSVSCSGDPQVRKKKHLDTGDNYVRQQKYSEAVIEYVNAVNIDPKAGDARFRLAEAYMASGNTRAAFPEYIRAADLLPDDVDSQLRAGHMLFKGGLFLESRARARTVLQKDPKNVTALVLLGNTLAGLKNLDDAVNVLERAVQMDPERAGIHANLGVFQYAQGDSEQAEAAFNKAVAVSGGSPESLLALGNFYRALRRMDDAMSALQRAYQAAPDNVLVNETLAALLIEAGRAAEAEPYLRRVVAISKDTTSQYGLASYFVSVARVPEALAMLRILASDKGQHATATNQIALVYYTIGDLKKAIEAVDDALTRAPRNAPLLTTKARLLLAQDKPDEALAQVSSALLIDNGLIQAHLTRGRILLAKRDIPEARKAFADTLKLHPTSLPASLELAQLHLSRKEIDSAIQFADQAVTQHKNSLQARAMLVRTLLVREDDGPRATREMRTLLERFPREPQVYTLSGALHLTHNDQVAAVKAFERALVLNPDSMEALSGLVAIDIAARRGAVARARIETALARRPKDVPLLLLAANVYGLTGEAGRIEELLQNALRADPENPEAYGLLAQVYVSAGRLDEARKQFLEIARLEPKSIVAPTMLGLLSYMRKDQAEARRWWEAALRIDQRAAAAANNLAWLYAENGGDLEIALQLAQTARARYPDVAEVNDTLGWVYYKKGLTVFAITYLQQSVEKDPSNPLYHYHLGMAFVQRGDGGKARLSLERALALKKDFDGAADARKALATPVF